MQDYDVSVGSGTGPKNQFLRTFFFLNPFGQRIGAFLMAVVLPGLFGPGIFLWTPGQYPSQDNTIAATVIALVIGLYLFRRIIKFPGVSASFFIMPTFASIYVGVMLVFLFARIDYSRFQFGLSFILCVSWFYFIYSMSKNARRHHVAIVPNGDVDGLHKFTDFKWTHLKEPELPAEDVTYVVADLRAKFSDRWEQFIADCAVSGIPVYHVKQLRESLTGRVEIEHLSENYLGNLLPNIAYLKVKRVLDFALAILVLPIFLPVIILVAIAIKLSEKGPIFFVQDRAGYRGKTFKVIKFRTMRHEPHVAADREAARTRENDERITKLGAILRRSRLDELPQIFNILLGDMSWVGPRPEASALSEWYEKDLPFYCYRYVVPPGITGWAQVNQGHVTSLEKVGDKLQYDFYYIKNFSPWLDILILLKTVRIMLSGFGAR